MAEDVIGHHASQLIKLAVQLSAIRAAYIAPEWQVHGTNGKATEDAGAFILVRGHHIVEREHIDGHRRGHAQASLVRRPRRAYM